ncbi:MAG: MFS transporter [Hyphomicrobiales bacterium]|nr:MFS transporter [Hyphomicrobiales bacterium]MBV9427054.1 MFS transporter [Bradyrhizobiaceae bacterium]
MTHITEARAGIQPRILQGATAILVTMSLGVLIAQIDTSVVNLAVKKIGASLGAGVTELQWVVDAYNLVYASLLLTAGTLADLYGRRRIFALGIALFTLGSLVCGFAPNAAVLIGGRAVAGLGAALEIPTSLAILTVAYQDKKERAHALGVWASCNGLAFIIGPTLGGVLVDSVGWRSIFLLIVPICVLALVLTMTSVPESTDPKGRSLDAPGQALAIAGLGALSLAVIEGPRWGWESIGSAAAFVASALSALLFVLRQKDSNGALVPLAMFKNRVFSASLGIAAAMTFGMYAMLFLTPLYLQAGRGDGALLAAIELLPMSVTFVVVSQLSGKIANAYGPRLPMTLGMAMMGTGLFMLALIPLNHSLLLIEAALLVIGCGLGLNTGPVNAVAVANASSARSGTASGLLNTARMVGATLGVALLGAIFAMFSGGSGSGHVAAGLPPAFIVGGIGEMLGALAAFMFIRRDSLDPSAGRSS